MGEKTDCNARSMESMDPPICSPAKEPLAGDVSRLTQQIGGLFQHCLDGGATIIHLLGQLLRAHKLADLGHFRHRLNKLGIQGDLLQRGLQGRHHFIRRICSDKTKKPPAWKISMPGAFDMPFFDRGNRFYAVLLFASANSLFTGTQSAVHQSVLQHLSAIHSHLPHFEYLQSRALQVPQIPDSQWKLGEVPRY